MSLVTYGHFGAEGNIDQPPHGVCLVLMIPFLVGVKGNQKDYHHVGGVPGTPPKNTTPHGLG